MASCSFILKMPSTAFNPEEVIDLISSDVEPLPSKKRSLEDASDFDTSLNTASSVRESKRPRIESPENAEENPEGFLSAEEGEIDESEPEAIEGAPTENQSEATGIEAEAQEPEQVAQPNFPSLPSTGWNSSISKSITRTSLNQPAPNTTAATDPPLFHQDSLGFKLPSFAEKREGSWFDRFQNWVLAFQADNSAYIHAITPTLALNAYAYYIDTLSGLKPKKRKSAKQASREMESTGALTALLQSTKPSNTSQRTEKLVAQSETKGPMNPSERSDEGTKMSKPGQKKEAEVTTQKQDDASDSEVEYEPWMAKETQKTEAVPTASEWASLLGESAEANGHPKASHTQEQPTIQQGTNLPLRDGVPTGDKALAQQRRYFPSAADPSKMCLLCGRETHTATSCPTLVCKLCGKNDHSEFYCPSHVRCDKCRQKGHRKAECPEKLALIKGEGLACAFCNSSDHLESNCTEPWRSFHPEDGVIRKVVSIPASCSLCGNNKHFFADCNRRRGNTPNPTWSTRNRDQYVDPDSGQASVEEVTVGSEKTKVTRGPELKIRGHASRTTNVHYSESDDSEVEFLGRRPLKQKAPLGQIRMASNIQMPRKATSRNGEPSRSYNLRSRSQTPVQPPLPPGPPPAGPPSRQGSFGHPPPPGVSGHRSRGPGQPQGLPHPLPAKPPSRDYRNVPPPPHLRGPDGLSRQQNDRGNASQGPRPRGGQRGGRGGRGGGRGKGRGRGK